MKIPMTVLLKNYFAPEKGQYGMSQGAYVVTNKGEFKCYNSGPIWFSNEHKGQDVDILGEWKQNQTTQQWYLACSFGKVVTQQGPPDAQEPPQQSPQQPNASQPAPQQQGRGVTEQDKQTSIERQAAFKAACEYCGRKGLTGKSVLELAIAGHYFIQTGNDVQNMPKPDPSITETGGTPNPDWVGDNPSKPTDDIPY